jgi:hypothetical protein
VTEPDHNRRFRVALIFLALLSSAAIILSGWALYARFTQSNAYRTADNRVWRAVICQIEMAVVKEHLPVAKEREALRFYDRLLIQDVQTDPCGLTKGKTP